MVITFALRNDGDRILFFNHSIETLKVQNANDQITGNKQVKDGLTFTHGF